MNQLGGFPLLTLVVFLPTLGGVFSLLIPQQRREGRQWLTLLIAATDLFVVLFLYMGWIQTPLGVLQFVDGPWPWIARWGVFYHLGVDGINLHLVLLTSLLTTIVLLQEWISKPPADDARKRTFWTLLLETGLLGALTAVDWILLSLFWLLAFLAAFFVLGHGARSNEPASRLAVAGAVVAAALVSITIGFSTQSTAFDLIDLYNMGVTLQEEAWMFWALVVASAITAALFPLHLWFSTTQIGALPGARILVGILLRNLGVYVLIRLCLQVFALSAIRFSNLLALLGTAGLLYGALATLASQKLSTVLTYWNLAQMGWVTTGIFTMHTLGLHGAILCVIACSLATASMLLLERERDLPARQPSLNWGGRLALAIAALAAIGIPGLAGFVGQSTLLLGFTQAHWRDGIASVAEQVWSIGIAIGLLLAAWGLFRAWRRTVATSDPQQIPLIVPLLILIVLLGLYPTLVTDIIGPSVHRLITQIRLGAGIPAEETEPSVPEPQQEQYFPLPDQPDGARFPDRQHPFFNMRPAQEATFPAPLAFVHALVRGT
jgi:NADH-quinone oxidoreductase subunit M